MSLDVRSGTNCAGSGGDGGATGGGDGGGSGGKCFAEAGGMEEGGVQHRRTLLASMVEEQGPGFDVKEQVCLFSSEIGGDIFVFADVFEASYTAQSMCQKLGVFSLLVCEAFRSRRS